jgi:anti-sigma factor RsiW
MNCADVIQYAGPYLDSELEAAITFQIQLHLSRCPHCRARYEREREIEHRIAQSLRASPDEQDDEKRWAAVLQRTLPLRVMATTRKRGFWNRIDAGKIAWISLVASLVFVAALASAGLGLRHGGHMAIPGLRPSDPPGGKSAERSSDAVHVSLLTCIDGTQRAAA